MLEKWLKSRRIRSVATKIKRSTPKGEKKKTKYFLYFDA